MSWNLYLDKPKCITCGHNGNVYSTDYTSNMRPMLNLAGFDWDMIEGLDCNKGLSKLEELINKMENDSLAYIGLNPSNGWGDYYSFIARLKELKSAWLQNPTAIFRHTR